MKLCSILILCFFFLLFIYLKSWTYIDDPDNKPDWKKKFDIILLILGICLVASVIITGILNL